MSIKFLGTLIDENYFTKFMAKSYWPCFRQVSKNVRFLFETSVHLNKKCLTQIYFSLVHSYRNYSNIAWARTTSTKLNEILLKQNHVAPIILNIDRQSNARPLLAEIKTFNVHHLNMQQVLALMQRVKYQVFLSSLYSMNHSYPISLSKNTLKQPHATYYKLRKTLDRTPWPSSLE